MRYILTILAWGFIYWLSIFLSQSNPQDIYYFTMNATLSLLFINLIFLIRHEYLALPIAYLEIFSIAVNFSIGTGYVYENATASFLFDKYEVLLALVNLAQLGLFLYFFPCDGIRQRLHRLRTFISNFVRIGPRCMENFEGKT